MKGKSIVVFLLIILALLGVADATYLTLEHFSGASVEIVCAVPDNVFFARFADCGQVLESEYATLFGFPVALLGLIYYALLLILAFATSFKKRWGAVGAMLVSGAGILMSVWFVYLQGWVLDAWCLYCLVSALVTALFFILSLVLARTARTATLLQSADGEAV